MYTGGNKEKTILIEPFWHLQAGVNKAVSKVAPVMYYTNCIFAAYLQQVQWVKFVLKLSLTSSKGILFSMRENSSSKSL